jgi:hypothetical protein
MQKLRAGVGLFAVSLGLTCLAGSAAQAQPVETFDKKMVPSDTLRANAPTLRRGPEFRKVFRVFYGGTTRIKFESRVPRGGNAVVQVYAGPRGYAGMVTSALCLSSHNSREWVSGSCDVDVPAGWIITVVAQCGLCSGDFPIVAIRKVSLHYDLVDVDDAAEVVTD